MGGILGGKNARSRIGAQDTEDRGKENRTYSLQRAMTNKQVSANKNEAEQNESPVKRPSMEKVIEYNEFKRRKAEQESSEESSPSNTAQNKAILQNSVMSKNTVSKNARMNNEKESTPNTVRKESLQVNMENTQDNLRNSAAKIVRQNDERDIKERNVNVSSVNTESKKDAGNEENINKGKEDRRSDVLIRKERPVSNGNEVSHERQNLKASKSEQRVRTAAFTTPTIKIRPDESKPIARSDLSKTLEERKENLSNIKAVNNKKVQVGKKIPNVKESVDTSANNAMVHAPRAKVSVEEAKKEVRPNLSKNLEKKEKKIL